MSKPLEVEGARRKAHYGSALLGTAGTKLQGLLFSFDTHTTLDLNHRLCAAESRESRVHPSPSVDLATEALGMDSSTKYGRS